jgi:hypothetical protein
MRVNLIQMLLKQRLLGQDGVFDNQLEQAGNVVSIKMMCFAKLNQTVQQVAFTVDITTGRCESSLAFANFYAIHVAQPAGPVIFHPAC